MNNVIKGQLAILVAMLTSLIVTLTACGGGGSSSAGGGGASRSASVSGIVTNNGIANLEIQSTNSLFVAVSDIFITVAHASGIPNISVVVVCAGGDTNQGVTNAEGKFKIDLFNIGSGVCSTSFDGTPGPDVNVARGMETELTVTLSGGSIDLVSTRQTDDDSTELEIKVTDGQSSDDDSSGNSDDDSSGNSGPGSSNSGSSSDDGSSADDNSSDQA